MVTMTAIRIGVINPAETEKVTMQVPDDVILRDLREAMVEQMGLPTSRSNGQPISYHLNIRADDGKLKRLEDEVTLGEIEVQEGDVLQLTVEMVAGCFLAGTTITLPEGKYIPIENLRAGDKVLSYDTHSKELCDGVVSDVYIGRADEYLTINDKIRVTESHLVFCNERWVQAKYLVEGDLLLLDDGTRLSIKSIETRRAQTTVYNLHLDTLTHTFFAESILVHNMAFKEAMAFQGTSDTAKHFKTSITPTKISNDVLSISISLPTSITLNEFFDSVTDRMQAIDFIYSTFSLLASKDYESINNFIKTIEQQGTQIPSNTYIHRFMTIANVEPLRIQSIHYGSPATFDLLGVGNVLEVVRETIKDLAWRGENEKAKAEVELKNKQVEAQKNKIEIERASVFRKLDIEKAALELETQRILIEKANTELLSQKIELLSKITNLQISNEDKQVMVSMLLPKALTITNNPVTPLPKISDPYQLLFKPKE
jgi:hypothetical protein